MAQWEKLNDPAAALLLTALDRAMMANYHSLAVGIGSRHWQSALAVRRVWFMCTGAAILVSVWWMQLKSYIRGIPDFPKQGILFRDITPLLNNGPALKFAIDRLIERCEPLQPDAIVSVEARGFLLAAPLAYGMGKPLAPVRKRGKLPYEKYSANYALEYGVDTLEIHRDAIGAGQRALIVDDLLATGGTVSAAAKLVRECGGSVVGYAFLIELADLNGRQRLCDEEVVSLITYD